MSKSQDAFRTISEVSDILDTPAHVLRFWESKFTQVKPVKRAGGRRYYRPSDVDLLAGIKKLLHVDGMTIKGAQKLMREQGVKHVTAIGAEIMGSAERSKAAPVEREAGQVVEHVTSAEAPPRPRASTPEKASIPEKASALEADAPAEPTVQATEETQPLVAETDTASDNVVPLQAQPETAADSSAEPHTSDAEAVDTPPAVSLPDVPADPSDSDSKAPARLFHLLRDAPPDALQARAAEIAPLLARMRTLRSRISLR